MLTVSANSQGSKAFHDIFPGYFLMFQGTSPSPSKILYGCSYAGPLLFVREGGVNFNWLPRRGGSGKLKKVVEVWCRGGSSWRLGRSWHFLNLIFSRFIIFTFRNYFTHCKVVLYIWRKVIFSCHHNFPAIIPSCLKWTRVYL